jgi:hypothetical protein
MLSAQGRKQTLILGSQADGSRSARFPSRGTTPHEGPSKAARRRPHFVRSGWEATVRRPGWHRLRSRTVDCRYTSMRNCNQVGAICNRGLSAGH